MLPSIEFLSLMEVPNDSTEYVVTIDGEVLPRKILKCPLEEALSEKLWDTEYVSLIVNNFKNIIEKEITNQRIVDAFRKWVIKNCFVLPIGSKALKKELEDNSNLKNYKSAINKFLSAVNIARPLTDKKIKKVAIVIPCCNQGEKVIAEAIRDGLSTADREIEIIWPRPEADLLYQLAYMTTDDVWSQIWQQKNDKPLACKCWDILKSLRHFLPNDTLGDLRRRIQELDPDFIISTYYDAPAHAILATICPVAIMHCDFYFSQKLHLIANTTDSQRVKIWSPTKLNIPKQFKDRADVSGYPIRSEIHKASDDEIHLFKKKWGISPNEKVIMMQMGRQGAGDILPKLLKEILSYSKQFPRLHFVFITGENQNLFGQLHDIKNTLPKRNDIRIQIHKVLNASQMNELYNMSSIMIGKAGGSTTAEIIQMGVYGIVFPSWRVETHNVQHLISIGLGEEFDPNKKIVPVLLKALEKSRPNLNLIDWKVKMSSLLNQSD
jgi:UDP-N-acetylglucosamine:LPS N-acetylglucosamine transferase